MAGPTASAASLEFQKGRKLTKEPYSKLVSDLVVFSADLLLAIKPLEPADRKMTTGHVLEVLDERIVHRGAPKGADDRKCLRGDLLHASNREISALGCVGGSGASAQCEDLNTGENGLWVR